MKYVAFIRGIGPGNPNMRGDKLKSFFEELGFTQVRTVISSGNVLFESEECDQSALEKYIEENLPKKLNFSRAVIIRNSDQLEKLVASDPFNGIEDLPNSRLNVTFLKKGGEKFSVIDPEDTVTPEIMSRLEKEHGKEITMRTWKTIEKIIKKLRENS